MLQMLALSVLCLEEWLWVVLMISVEIMCLLPSLLPSSTGTWAFISCPAGAENGAEPGLLLSWIFQAPVLLSGGALPTYCRKPSTFPMSGRNAELVNEKPFCPDYSEHLQNQVLKHEGTTVALHG